MKKRTKKFEIGDKIALICKNPEDNDYGTIIAFGTDGDPKINWNGFSQTGLTINPEYIRKLTKLEKVLK